MSRFQGVKVMEFLECVNLGSVHAVLSAAWAVFDQGARFVLQNIGGLTVGLLLVAVLDRKLWNGMYWKAFSNARTFSGLGKRLDNLSERMDVFEGHLHSLAKATEDLPLKDLVSNMDILKERSLRTSSELNLLEGRIRGLAADVVFKNSDGLGSNKDD